MSVEFDRESPGKFDPRTLNRKTLNRWIGRRLNLVEEAAHEGARRIVPDVVGDRLLMIIILRTSTIVIIINIIISSSSSIIAIIIIIMIIM